MPDSRSNRLRTTDLRQLLAQLVVAASDCDFPGASTAGSRPQQTLSLVHDHVADDDIRQSVAEVVPRCTSVGSLVYAVVGGSIERVSVRGIDYERVDRNRRQIAAAIGPGLSSVGRAKHMRAADDRTTGPQSRTSIVHQVADKTCARTREQLHPRVRPAARTDAQSIDLAPNGAYQDRARRDDGNRRGNIDLDRRCTRQRDLRPSSARILGYENGLARLAEKLAGHIHRWIEQCGVVLRRGWRDVLPFERVRTLRRRALDPHAVV